MTLVYLKTADPHGWNFQSISSKNSMWTTSTRK